MRIITDSLVILLMIIARVLQSRDFPFPIPKLRNSLIKVLEDPLEAEPLEKVELTLKGVFNFLQKML